MTVIHNKLVRDKIPEIIKSAGKTPSCKTLSEDEYLKELDKKLIEECNEYLEDKSIEEIADVLEVLRAITRARGFTLEELEYIRAKKAEERGEFQKKIFLEKVD